MAPKKSSARPAKAGGASPFADLIFHSGRIYTIDPGQPWVVAVAVRNGRIAFVGSAKAVQSLQGPTTKVIDLDGRMMMPGLGDVHYHHTRGGQLDQFELSFPTSASFDVILALVKARAAKTPAGEWICGGIWSSELIERLRTPGARAALDDVSPRHPVMLRDDSLHNRGVNSLALDVMGVTAETPDPELGQIVRDRGTGAAVGLLVEKASALAEQAVLESLKRSVEPRDRVHAARR